MMTLPELQKSISEEFENKFSVMLERAGREDGESSTEWLEKIESFLRQSLTKAYQLGKENVKCFGCDDVTLPYWCVGCVNKVLNEKDKAYQAIAEMTEKANKFLSNK